MNIQTSYNPLCHRWSAWADDEELIGTGDTEDEARADLLDKMEDA